MHRSTTTAPLRLTGRTIATTDRGVRGTVTTTEHYAVDADGATDEQLASLIEELKGLRSLVRRTTNRG